MAEKKNFNDLVEMMKHLRSENGCPWDREQTYQTLAPMLIEEAYEVIEAAESAAESSRWDELRDELGDLLFQIIFYAQIGAESDHFDIYQSIARVHDKMTRRHPHVFGEAKVSGTADVLSNWESIKAVERRESGKNESGKKSLLDGTSAKMPALIEANQLTTKAARVGFDWQQSRDLFAKLDEEVRELGEEVNCPERNQKSIVDELGDILFVVANIARWYGVEPESALKAANRKFRRRFAHIERRLEEQEKSWPDTSLEEMDKYWDEAKKIEREKREVGGENI